VIDVIKVIQVFNFLSHILGLKIQQIRYWLKLMKPLLIYILH